MVVSASAGVKKIQECRNFVDQYLLQEHIVFFVCDMGYGSGFRLPLCTYRLNWARHGV